MLHLQHRNQQFLRKWPSTAMWLDTNLAFRRLDTTMADQWPQLPLFLNLLEFAFVNFDCNVNNICFIVYSHYKNTSIRYCEEYKKSPDSKNSTVSWPRTQFWIFLDPSLYEVLFYLDTIIDFKEVIVSFKYLLRLFNTYWGFLNKQKTRAYCVISLIWRSLKFDFF